MAFTLSMRGSGRNRNPFPTAAQLQARISAALDAAAKAARVDFARHGQGYTGGIDINVETELDAVEIFTTDERAIWVNEGTRPHTIRARSAPSLAFPSQYTPGTTPGQIAGRPAYSGGNYVYAQETYHPGIQGRHVNSLIVDHVGPLFIAEMKKAVTNG